MKYYLATMHCETLQPNGAPYAINDTRCHSVVSDPMAFPNRVHIYAGVFALLLVAVIALIVLKRRKI